jgi:hypothetical protein
LCFLSLMFVMPNRKSLEQTNLKKKKKIKIAKI